MNLIRFFQDPLKYLCSAPSMVVVPVNVVILGPPKAGKTTSMYKY